jgi:HlyD family secretion protein
VTRGPIAQTVAATGSLEAVETVLVGTQVSGRVSRLHADFNDIVARGELLAELDPSLFETDVAQARAGLARAEAEVERYRVTADDAGLQDERALALAGRQLISVGEADVAHVSYREALMRLLSADAEVKQARAVLRQGEVNLERTRIHSPVDGVVVSRDVDVGQTVAASLQAPTLFTIAADLTRLRVLANVSEADVGLVHAGQPATFTVDAYPDEVFRGTVLQVRLQPVVSENVVAYTAIVETSNADLRLRPGMTATVTIEVARRDDARLIPAAAARFRPTAAAFEALGQAVAAAPSCAATDTVVWRWSEGGLAPACVTVGIADGTSIELVGDLPGGAALVTAMELGGDTPPSSSGASQSPLLSGPPAGMPPPPSPGG